jgi:para-aminobenzoate synthetase component 1
MSNGRVGSVVGVDGAPYARARAANRDGFLWTPRWLATGVMEVSDDVDALDGDGFWAVVAPFEGSVTCVRFDRVEALSSVSVARARLAALARGPWRGPAAGAWRSSLTEWAYRRGVTRVREAIAAGDVYQVNLCRMLSAPLAPAAEPAALGTLLARRHPARHATVLDVPAAGLAIVSASPELFLSRSGRVVRSSPIKGTGRTAADLLDKDVAENIMIVDLVRNDLGRVARTGGVSVPRLCAVEDYPGLVQLVSTVRAELADGVGWRELLGATTPAGSVSGAPKIAALEVIRAIEPGPRGPYCGAIGWVDATAKRAELAVGIRTFELAGTEIRFGTGAGITWGSDPAREWRETELKADRLTALASAAPGGRPEGAGSGRAEAGADGTKPPMSDR